MLRRLFGKAMGEYRRASKRKAICAQSNVGCGEGEGKEKMLSENGQLAVEIMSKEKPKLARIPGPGFHRIEGGSFRSVCGRWR